MQLRHPLRSLTLVLSVALVPSLALARPKPRKDTTSPAAAAVDPLADTDPVAPPQPAEEPAPSPVPEPVAEVQTVSATDTLPEKPEPQPVAPAPETPPAFVEHLGPDSYPGKTRGLVGGSLYLEPSFHGLQWPVMRHTGLGVSGSIWVDSGYEKITREKPLSPDTERWLQQARAVLRITPTYALDSFFVQGQAEFVGNSAQNKSQSSNVGLVDTDDLWIRVGQWNAWDVKVGRFEGWELYHTGMGLDINTLERRGATQEGGGTDMVAPDYYGLTYLHDRPISEGLGNVALHVYPAKILRFELLGRLGTTETQSGGDNHLGARPMAILDVGWLKLKAGGEYVTISRAATTNTTVTDDDGNTSQKKVSSKYEKTQRGAGASFQMIFDPIVEFGGNFGYGQVRESDDEGNAKDTASYDTVSVGGFANLRLAKDLLLGAGVNWTTQNDKHRDPNSGDTNYTAHLQTFGALQYHLAKQLLIKAVVAYARSDFKPSFSTQNDIWSNEMLSGRLRLMYLY